MIFNGSRVINIIEERSFRSDKIFLIFKEKAFGDF